MTDCIVVGGGVIGMLTARELARAGCSVTLLERGQVGRESSWAGGGILSPLYPWRYPPAVTALASWSQRHYKDLAASLAEETGEDPQWTRSGLLIGDLEESDAAQAWADKNHAVLEVITAAEAQELEPTLGSEHDGAIWMPDVAQIRNPRLIKALRQSLEGSSVEVHEHAPVLGLELIQGRAAGVRVRDGAIHAETVIIAAGAWSRPLLEVLKPPVHVTPVQGQMLLLRGVPGLMNRIILGGGRYLIPRRDGCILVGSTLELRGFDKTTTDDAQRELREAAVKLVPTLAELELGGHWAGLRPGSPNGVPYIAAHPAVRGLYVNAGHYRNGLVLAPASARLVTDIGLGREPILAPADYAVEAFREPGPEFQ